MTDAHPWARRRTLRPIHDDLAEIFAAIDDTEVLDTFAKYRNGKGRRGFPIQAFWRAFLVSRFLDQGSVADTRRRLRDDDKLTAMCGFGEMPQRSAFYAFFGRMASHADLIEKHTAALLDYISRKLPDFGQIVAIDSTNIRAHSNPDRKHTSNDPDAAWTAKTKTRNGKEYKEWTYGFKLHLMADAKWGIPSSATLLRPTSTTIPNCRS